MNEKLVTTRTLEDEIPVELQEDLQKSYTEIDLSKYGKIDTHVIEKTSGKIAKDIRGAWERSYTYKLVENGSACSLRAVIETTTYLK